MWVFITSGRGPGECQIAVERLARLLIDDATTAAVEAVLLDVETGPHGLLSALIALGAGAETLVASWEGTLQWICPSPIRQHWKRKNWFVSVNIIRPPALAEALRDADLRFEAYRASGPGGQHVNKTMSAVRVVHLPTNTIAQAQEERSQHRNKALALARLAALLAARKTAADQAVEREKWTKHDDLQRGNPVRVYRGPDFTLDRSASSRHR
jgi:peptide chain release factor